MLKLDAPAERVRALGRALRVLADEDRPAFEALFDPARGGGWQIEPAPAHRTLYVELEAFGLIAGGARGAPVGRHRIRRVGDRFYLLELGEADLYRQDVWPETDALVAALDAW